MWGVGIVITGVLADSATVAWVLDERESGSFEGPVPFGEREMVDSFMPISAKAEVTPCTCEGPGLEMGWLTLVDKYMMSLPCTTRLSFDFLRSNVSISVCVRCGLIEWRLCDHDRCLPWPPSSRSRTSLTLTLTTPRKP